MKGFICIIAFVAYTSAGVSNYGSGVGIIGSPIKLPSVGLGSGIGGNSGLGVQRLSGTQPIYSSGSIGLTKTPIGLSGSSYALNQGLPGSSKNQGQVVHHIAVIQPALTPISAQKPSINLSQGVGRIIVTKPIITGRSLESSVSGIGINSAPVRKVSIAQPTLTASNYGTSSKLQNVRPVSYSQPILSTQPIRSVQVSSLPKITTPPIGTVQVVRQPIPAKSTINVGGGNFGSGVGAGRGQAVRRVTITQSKLTAPNYGTNSNVQNVRPVSYSQPIGTIQPLRSVQVSSLPKITAQPIRTVQVVRQPIPAKSPINVGGASLGSGLGIGQGQAVRRVTITQPKLITPVKSGISNQVKLSPVSFAQPKSIAPQPIRTIHVISQPIISSPKLNLSGASYGSGLGLSQAQPIRRVSIVQPTYGQTGSSYGVGRSSSASLPILTSSNYGSVSGISSIGNSGKVSRGGGFGFGFGK